MKGEIAPNLRAKRIFSAIRKAPTRIARLKRNPANAGHVVVSSADTVERTKPIRKVLAGIQVEAELEPYRRIAR